jgi:tetratricopeptide (TPR) repeat protein
VALGLLAATAVPLARPMLALGGADTVLDAKRKAAGDLLRDGKVQDAISMYQEVMKADPNNYKDTLQLARAYDKLNRPEEALDFYRRTLDMPGAADDRTAKAEAERRIKMLDAAGAKFLAAEEEYLRKLDSLERDAMVSKDMRALQRVFTLRGGVWNARGYKDGFGVDMPAAADWLDSGVVVKKGVKYHVRAAGNWVVNGAQRCTADGISTAPPTAHGPYGCLLGSVQGAGRFERLGSDTTFIAPATGTMSFNINVMTHEERKKSTGRLYILIKPVD